MASAFIYIYFFLQMKIANRTCRKNGSHINAYSTKLRTNYKVQTLVVKLKLSSKNVGNLMPVFGSIASPFQLIFDEARVAQP